MKTVLIETKEITDVRNKKLKYLIISDGTKELIINVGEKTYTQAELLEDLIKTPENEKTMEDTTESIHRHRNRGNNK